MSTQADWATAALVAALPLAFVLAPVLGEIAARLRRRRGIVAASRSNAGG